MKQKRSENLRIARNCDGITNKNMVRKNVGLVSKCPRALKARVYRLFFWAQDWARWRVLPYAGFDFAGQPAPVTEAIRIVEAATVETLRKMAPKGGR
jgi:hypothetical protein